MLDAPLIPLLHAAATLFMTGLIWFVQVVHYPLFLRANPQDFVAFEREHQQRTSRVVTAPMLIELGMAACLLWIAPGAETVIGMGLLVVIWSSTAFLQVPAHRRLAEGYDKATIRRLVNSNWIRTISWTLRAMLVMWSMRV